MSEPKDPETAHPTGKLRVRNVRRQLLVAVPLAVVGVVALVFGYLYAISPAAIREPKMDHYHFRMQVVVDGKAVDFGSQVYQTAYEKGQCSADLSDTPIHFHDGKDQFVHIHWDGMTGGMVLKNYGWNVVGGPSGSLGYRMDNLPRVQSVGIHGKHLSTLPEGAKFWVYTGDEQHYRKRSFEDFKQQDLEIFFGKRSNFMSAYQPGSTLLDWLLPKAAAHGSEFHGEETEGETDEQRLTRINNLLGNVVIFVQKDEPSAEQIQARFADLEPLSDSTCGG